MLGEIVMVLCNSWYQIVFLMASPAFYAAT